MSSMGSSPAPTSAVCASKQAPITGPPARRVVWSVVRKSPRSTQSEPQARRANPSSRAEHSRVPRLRRDDAPLGRATGDLEHELLARRLLELRALLDRNDERARPTGDTVLVVDVELIELHLPHAV